MEPGSAPRPDPVRIRYRFLLEDGTEAVFDVGLDPVTLAIVQPPEVPLPSWTVLEFHQCPHCPLSIPAHPHCPVAAHLVALVRRFDGLQSHAPAHLEVVTQERSVSRATTLQKGLASLMGLVMASSGCPHTAPLRPMARFHLPLATTQETTYRAATMYLLAQYFRRRDGLPAELELSGLSELYERIHILNRAMNRRLSAASRTDSSSNAVVILDVFAQSLPLAVEDALEGLRPLFAPYLRGGGAP